jgi:hypothetical protein
MPRLSEILTIELGECVKNQSEVSPLKTRSDWKSREMAEKNQKANQPNDWRNAIRSINGVSAAGRALATFVVFCPIQHAATRQQLDRVSDLALARQTQSGRATIERVAGFGGPSDRIFVHSFACSPPLEIRFTPVSNVAFFAGLGVLKRHNRCSALTVL